MEANFEQHVIERAVLVGLNADCFTQAQTATDETLEELEVSVSSSAELIQGELMNGNQSFEKVNAWVKKLNL